MACCLICDQDMFRLASVKSMIADHPWPSASMAITLSLVVIDDCLRLGSGGFDVLFTVLSSAEILACLIFIIYPSVGAWLCLAVESWAAWSPVEMSSLGIFIAFIIVGYMGYVGTVQGVVAVLCLMASYSTGFLLVDEAAFHEGGVLALFACLALIASCGAAVQKKMVALKREEALHRKNDEQEIAARLHDYTCNGLSNIIMLSDRLAEVEGRRDEGDVFVNDVHQISVVAKDALSKTRLVIQRLKSDEWRVVSSSASGHTCQDVRSFVEERSSLLEKMGFCSSVVYGESFDDGLSSDGLEFLVRFLYELFGNIGKHADPRFGFSLSLGKEGDFLKISLCDIPIKDAQSASRRGTGMTYYRAKIISHGGEWIESIVDGCWLLNVSVALED